MTSLSVQKRRASWRAYAARQQVIAFELHRKLIETLGGQCVRCEGDEVTPLTIDHVGGNRTWSIRRKNALARVRLYWAEYRAGVSLRVLCLSCNAEDRNIRALKLEAAPF